ncbi:MULTISPECIES: metallophosphoesterase [unclassified Shewanella]|uniref:metallophosphoesterase n=1 Tax=unclassified Shewanella TaxID=196818 RepID=UPI000C81A8A5|nr:MULTISPECIES: metallophosphoesterase [unclassified Shewanella]PMG28014.1 serine/threonine protein phosphatase [Shewanella sp. 10N.286.52.C2]PMG47859.1 serine/threonine protein phosphatase [Shewanella sp. 10N.286.52.B9]
MKFIPVSDLHLDNFKIRKDFWLDFDPEAVLIIAGDAANALSGMEYIKTILCKYFRAVIYVCGNHEWYSNKNRLYKMNPYHFIKESVNNVSHSTVLSNSPLKKIKYHSQLVDNLYFLNNESIVIDGFLIYGGSLWFPIHTYSKSLLDDYGLLMNDPKFINYKIIEEQFKSFVDNFPPKVDLVVSHHLPNLEAFALDINRTSEYAPFYHASLSDELILRTRYWIAGHQHDATEKLIAGHVKFISNPKGSVPMTPGLLRNKVYHL